MSVKIYGYKNFNKANFGTKTIRLHISHFWVGLMERMERSLKGTSYTMCMRVCMCCGARLFVMTVTTKTDLLSTVPTRRRWLSSRRLGEVRAGTAPMYTTYTWLRLPPAVAPPNEIEATIKHSSNQMAAILAELASQLPHYRLTLAVV